MILHTHGFLDWLQIAAAVIVGIGIGGWVESMRRDPDDGSWYIPGVWQRDVTDPGSRRPPAPPPAPPR